MSVLKYLLIPAAAAAGGLFCVAPEKADPSLLVPFLGRNIAHRGLYAGDQSVPENSLPAFSAAAAGGYGVELDVHLSSDGQVVVFHDDSLKRMCGVDREVEDLTLKELSSLYLAGSGETIPLLREVFTVLGGVPVIVELKHSNTGRGDLLCEKTLEHIRNYPGPVCVQSFDPFLVRWFRKTAPDLLRGQLSAQTEDLKQGTSAGTAVLLSHCLFNFLSRPNYIAYRIGKKPLSVRLSERMGAARAAWTSHDPETEKAADIVIFEHYRPSVRFR